VYCSCKIYLLKVNLACFGPSNSYFDLACCFVGFSRTLAKSFSFKHGGLCRSCVSLFSNRSDSCKLGSMVEGARSRDINN